MYISTKVPVHTAPLPSPHLRPSPTPTAHRAGNVKWPAATRPPSTPQPGRSSVLALGAVLLGQQMLVTLKGTVSIGNCAHNQSGQSMDLSVSDDTATNADNANASIVAPLSPTRKWGGRKKNPKRKNQHSNALLAVIVTCHYTTSNHACGK